MLGQLTTPQIDLHYVGEAVDGSVSVQRALGKLDRAVTPAQVARALVEGGVSSARATSGALVLLTDNRRELRVIYGTGDATECGDAGRRLPTTANVPLAEVVRSRRELWLTHPDDLVGRFPGAEPLADAASWAVLPLLVDNVILGAVGWSFRRRGFTSHQCACLRVLAQAGGVALYRAGLFDAERRLRMQAELARHEVMRRDRLMAEVSATLDATSDAADASASLARIAHLTLRILGEWCAIDVLDERGRVHRVAAAHVDPVKGQILRQAQQRSAGTGRKLPRGLSQGKPAVIATLNEGAARQAALGVRQARLLRQVGLRRVLVMPLRIHGHTFGTLSLASEDASRAYSSGDLVLADRIARRCAASLEYRRLHETAERASQAREDFVAATSHELRIPLSHIKGFVSTLRTTDTVWDAETRGDFLAEIEQEADRLARLVETLLDLSRIDSGGHDPTTRAATPPAALVEAGVDRVRPSLGDHPLHIQLADDLPPVCVDASQVERVLANLLDNAAKYSPPTEPIGVIGRLAGDAVAVRIEDRGLGIPPEHLERIFEPFFREPTGGYPAKPGTGLGLAICRGIIRSQGGRIWAEQRQGGGAAFVFTLPLAASSRRT
jgi:signal transduction histidine kinase